MTNGKYKMFGIFYPFFYVLGYLLVILITKEETIMKVHAGFLLFYSFIIYFFIQFIDKHIRNYFCGSYKREREILIIGLVVLGICLIFSFATHLELKIPSSVNPEVVCISLYFLSQALIAVYLKAKKIDEKEENEENS